jgi:DMSO/TMAO reductase YedYZ molybdopterin-dependent catalytic subunit
MLRDALDRPLTDGFTVHGTDVETVWEDDVPLVTPNDRFFVRSHTRPPVVDADRWRLLLTGDGLHQDCTLSLADLRHLSPVTEELALECTGNGRQFFARQQGTPRPGTQWETGAIGVARWTGVPLARVLRRAGVRPDAVSVMAVGLDDPYVEDGVDHGRVRRPLPIEKALDDVLVCWEMNGEPLPPDHGHPVRLVVPGWVGIASIKWLGSCASPATTSPRRGAPGGTACTGRGGTARTPSSAGCRSRASSTPPAPSGPASRWCCAAGPGRARPPSPASS